MNNTLETNRPAEAISARYNVEIWEERDRLGIWVTDARTEKIVFETWDDNARQIFVDGFFERGNRLKESVLNYLERNRVI